MALEQQQQRKPQQPRKKGKSSLAILERAYRGSVEDQYGHIVWLSKVMHGMGAHTAVLLKGDTVFFAKRHQPAQQLCIGGQVLDGLSHYETTVRELIAAGVPVFAYRADCIRYQLCPDCLVEGVRLVDDAALVELVCAYDCVWYW
ncbi:MAG: hypothetical protein ACLGI6_17315 [Gammaproteobacteria bacterium]